ncbi:type VI secretion system baseplate subunit TssG [Marinomonas sp. THO17]|uniref:type VI secretion system baseplate subunit TssG n=1 Tax=Marinomonas sp. THO17 TaxID=3149048 RepID=UPI00336C2870
MATTHWRTGYSVAELFVEPDANWSFHQLTRLLVGMNLHDDDLLEALNNSLFFSSFHSQVLPPGEIRKVTLADTDALGRVNKQGNSKDQIKTAKRKQNKAKHQVECSYYNLTGLDGPLVEPFVDLLRQDLRYGKGALAAFIDLFNNRLQALRYLIHAQHHATLTSSLAQHTSMGQFMLAISGHEDSLQRQRHQQEDATLLSLAGSLANCRMTLPMMRKLFAIVLGVSLIALRSLVGRWLTIQKNDHTLLGQRNQRLSAEATLGTRVWDQQAAVELVLGPLSLVRIQRLVPGGTEHQALRDLVSWVCDKRSDCRITLVCLDDDVEPKVTTLSHQEGGNNRLAYGAVLQGQDKARKEVRFMLDLVQ